MKNKRGYTLIELVITLAILGIMITPIFNSFMESNKVNIQSRKRISANYLAQNQIELYKGTAVITAGTTNLEAENGGFEFKIDVQIEEINSAEYLKPNESVDFFETEKKNYDLIFLIDDASATKKILTYTSRNNISIENKTFTELKTALNATDFEFDIENDGTANMNINLDNIQQYTINTSTNCNVSTPISRRIAVVGLPSSGSSVSFTIDNNSTNPIRVKPFGKGFTVHQGIGSIIVSNNLTNGNYIDASSGEKLYKVVVTVTDKATNKEYAKVRTMIGRTWKLGG